MQAQLDSIHWIPPMHARGEWGPQYLYISTPETVPFLIEIRDGAGSVLAILEVSNAQPQRYDIGSTNDTKVVVLPEAVHKVLIGKGLVLEGPRKFYVNFRFHSDSQFQAGDLTCKGTAALGKVFRIGHVWQASTSNSRRSNFIGVMAYEDSTTVTLSDFDIGVDFEINGVSTPVTGPQVFNLRKGESVVMTQYLTGSPSGQPPNGLIGALLSASRPVAVNVGSWTGSPVNDNSNDVGLDQIAPFDLMGEEYILNKGNGSAILETPIVVAHLNNTQVRLNGSSTPIATLNAGEKIRIETSNYTAQNNLYILCSKPAYVYQMIGGVPTGGDQQRTAGLIFVPPVSCGIPNAVDNIFQPNLIGNLAFDGGLMITAMRDSAVTLRVDGAIVSLGAANTVAGNPDFVTYRNITAFNSSNPPTVASVIAEGAVQVALFGRNGAAGYGAFYSGFSQAEKANISLSNPGDGICPDTLYATGRFDGVQWFLGDSLVSSGAQDTMYIAFTNGQFIARGYLGVCRRVGFAQDTIIATINTPIISYSSIEPSCYGFSDASIQFGSVLGGASPFEYSINSGQTFGASPKFEGIGAGDYQLVARDTVGCYNRPVEITIGQPDSLGVEAVIVRIEEPPLPGKPVQLQAQVSREVVGYAWLPSEMSTCDTCILYNPRPLESTWYTVQVTDEFGCMAEDSIFVPIQPPVYAPNVIYPESSEGNDRFTMFSKENIPINWVHIYDRWGTMVYERTQIQTNDTAQGWDGMFRDQLLPSSVYVFVAELQYGIDRTILMKGDILLVR